MHIFLGDHGECRADADLGGYHGSRPRRNYHEEAGSAGPALHFFADFEHYGVRENSAESTAYGNERS